MQALPEVSLVSVTGFANHQFRIELSTDALMRHNLSVADVAAVVSRQNIDLPAGIVETHEQDVLLRFVDERASVAALEDLVIVAARGGAELRLSDLGHVTDRFELAEDKIVLNGRRAALLNVDKTKDQDSIRVAQRVKAFVADERLRHPNVEIEVTRDMSTLVKDRLELLVLNGLQGMVLVFLTMWLFFNGRLAFWVVMSLPVSFLGAFFLVPYFDLTINMLSMVGLLLALGLIMDDGIVIAENIATHRAKGKPALQASVDGVREVSSGVFSSFLTTVCVLGPLATLEGNIGKILLVVPVILILVMTVSLVEAFVILPSHLAHAMEHLEPKQGGRARRWLDARIEWVRENLFGAAVDMLLKWRYLWIGCVVGMFLIAVGLFAGGVMKFEAMPAIDGNVIVARVLMPPGTPLEKTEDVVERMTRGLDEVNATLASRQPDGRDLIETVYVQYNSNEDVFESGPHVATVFADLLAAEVRDARLDDVLQLWRDKVGRVPDALSIAYSEPTIGPTGRNIEVRLQGGSFERLKAASIELKNYLSGFVGVYNLAEDLRRGKPELRVRLREGALGLGLDAAAVSRQLRAAFHGATADEIQVDAESYEMDVQLKRSDQDSLADLDYFHITLPDGKQVPLNTVAEIEKKTGWSRIARVNGQRTVTVRGDVDALQTNTVKVIAQLEREFLPQLAERYPEIVLSYEGEIVSMDSTKTWRCTMDSHVWRTVYQMIVSEDRSTPRFGRNPKYTDVLIVGMYLWSVDHDRPLCWACRRENYSSRFRPRKLPSVSQFCRRIKTPRCQQILQGVHDRLAQPDVASELSFLDGRALVVGPHTKDREARRGHVSGGFADGYKLHAWATKDGRIPLWSVVPLNVNEKRVAKALIAHGNLSDLVLADMGYDGGPLYDAVADRGMQLLTPMIKKNAGQGHRRQSPSRLAVAWAWGGIAGYVYRERVSVERFFGHQATCGGGLGPLPGWVRTLERVRRWVGAKLIIYHARLHLRRAAG